ncbi:MAG: zinc-binding alcohol dehydrogenase family protein [Planctomycetota bacterium]
MRAIGYRRPGPISEPDALIAFDADTPDVGPRDLLVEVKGVSVNPVDVKVRGGRPAAFDVHVLGYDAAGVVREVGPEVAWFEVGDEVYYAGDLTRPGSNAELQAVDERLVGKKPTSLGFAEAAGLPLTSITAWELLFDSLGLEEGGGAGESLLVIGGAGGVGSILIQLAKKLTALTVIATASRPETVAWVKKMGADHVVNHREPLVEQVKSLGLTPGYVAMLTASDQHHAAVVELIRPRGRVAIIDDPAEFDLRLGKPKSLTYAWEFMFARSMFGTPDMAVQHELLNRVSQMIDDGVLVSTVKQNLGKLSVETLIEAHRLQETGAAIGKNVLEGMG